MRVNLPPTPQYIKLLSLCADPLPWGDWSDQIVALASSSVESICLQGGRRGIDPWVGKMPWRRERLPTSIFWPGEFHWLYSPWGRKESDRTEWLSLSLFKFSWIQYVRYLVSSKKGWTPFSQLKFVVDIKTVDTKHTHTKEVWQGLFLT